MGTAHHGRTQPHNGGQCPPIWEHAFDAIIANGSLEHFVQAADAAAGRADAIYEDMFAICRRLLVEVADSSLPPFTFAKRGPVRSTEILRGSLAHPRGSVEFQFATLVETFGGWYPEPGQLEHCADSHFELVEEDDGTHDYRLTSEYWLRQAQMVTCHTARGLVHRRQQMAEASAHHVAITAKSFVGSSLVLAVSSAGANAIVATNMGGDVAAGRLPPFQASRYSWPGSAAATC